MIGLSNMRPSLSLQQQADAGAGKVVFSRDLRLHHASFGVPCSDLPHQIVRELRMRVAFAFWKCTMTLLIGVIGLARVPSKIAQAVIGVVAVIVTSLHAVWAWAHKGSEHDSVDIHAGSGEHDLKSIHGRLWQPAPPWAFDLVSPASYPGTPHAAVVTDTISREAWNVSVFYGRIINSHRRPLYGVGDWLGQAGASNARLSALNLAKCAIHVNSARSILLETIARERRITADKSGKPADIAAADAADIELAGHRAGQARVDAMAAAATTGVKP